MKRLRIAAAAEADLTDIAVFIATDSPARAGTFVRQLRTACRGLLDKPYRFPRASPGRNANVRKRPYGAYVIIYAVDENAVEIVRVLHGARDYQKIFEAID